jgi:hypothetical protein
MGVVAGDRHAGWRRRREPQRQAVGMQAGGMMEGAVVESGMW